MSSKTWVYASEGGPSGPVTTEQVETLLERGVLTPESRIRPEFVDSWATVSTWLPQLTNGPAEPPAPPPLPQDKGAWTDTHPHPWRRYFARIFDIAVIGSLTWILISILFFLIDPVAATSFFALFDGPGGKFLDAILTAAVTIPGVTLMIGLTGVSVGKWVFGVKVVTPEGRPIGLAAAFSREIQVWTRGLAFAIPLVSLFTLIVAYRTLVDERRSSWDPRRERIVLHRPMNALQIVLIVLSIPVLVALRLYLATVS